MSDPNAKDPLAVLEELLAKQKQAAESPEGTGAATGAVTTEADQAALQAQKQAEYERLQAEAVARDAQLLEAQEKKLEEIESTPEYQARVQQEQAQQEEKQKSADEQEGFEIAQLSTMRVPVSESE